MTANKRGATVRRRSDRRDKIIGRQVRLLRLESGLSQEGLAELLGLTFQQVQKYESGVNRIAASRLFDIARVLGVPIAEFFRDLADDASHVLAQAEPPSHDSAELLRCFGAISRPGWRKIATRAVREIAAMEVELVDTD